MVRPTDPLCGLLGPLVVILDIAGPSQLPSPPRLRNRLGNDSEPAGSRGGTRTEPGRAFISTQGSLAGKNEARRVGGSLSSSAS